MPVVHKSTIKRARQSETRRQRNRAKINSARSVIKKVRTAVDQKDATLAQSLLTEAHSQLHKAVSKGVVKKNTASRKISRLSLQVNKLLPQ
jgi:small subunit ribosomal protein S20